MMTVTTICTMCGKKFVAHTHNALRCPVCRTQRLHESQKLYRESHVEQFHASDRAYKQRNAEKIRERDRLRKAASRNRPGAKLEYARMIGKLTYCERMRVTMYPLPCGTRGECKGCVHCPAGAACGNDGHYRWDMESLNGGRSFR